MTPSFKSLYVHFPFCESKCHYCDFYSLGREKTRDTDPAQFEAALLQECTLHQNSLSAQLDTLFFGGGTPSMTPPSSMERSLAPLKLQQRLTQQTEWTMEANPSSIDAENLTGYRALGVNRISMGVQSLKNSTLQNLGRVHDSQGVMQALETVFKSGFDNVSVDLLCGVPGQDLSDLERELEQLTAFPITHLSCYLLTLAPHHRMHSQLPHEDVQLEHLLLVDEWMVKKGFTHYEISNYCKPGKQARHNLAYWKGHSYLGLGPSAHSFDQVEKKRWKNVSSLHKYGQLLGQGTSPVEWSEVLTPEQLTLEKWMLALRLDDGFPESWLQSKHQRAKAAVFSEKGWIQKHPEKAGTLRLTARGFALSDQIVRALI
ncbi:radical SAM family heme chaperone HemW [bacterium]|jgi:oxygen-independent coproporphyrinogen-3 oxidase|nr:radical SAM family heme chaperone HemW [bacterium]